jgi:hypothetical protein
MKKYYLPVNEFALPSPRVGSIDTYSGFGAGSKRAIKIHQEIEIASPSIVRSADSAKGLQSLENDNAPVFEKQFTIKISFN